MKKSIMTSVLGLTLTTANAAPNWDTVLDNPYVSQTQAVVGAEDFNPELNQPDGLMVPFTTASGTYQFTSWTFVDPCEELGVEETESVATFLAIDPSYLEKFSATNVVVSEDPEITDANWWVLKAIATSRGGDTATLEVKIRELS